MIKSLPALFLTPILFCSSILADEISLEYDGFSIKLDCERRGAVRFEYTAMADTGNLPRKHTFSRDEESEIADRCQQKSVYSYASEHEGYDRGHLVPANHLDHSPEAIRQSNFMTNILPQHRNMNRGAWLLTEEIIECVRMETPLQVIGGVIWGFNPHDDYYLKSHGVRTPDYFWKLVIRKNNGEAIAWIIPNSGEATRSKLDDYLVAIEVLEDAVDETFTVTQRQRKFSRGRELSWEKPAGCNLG